MVNFSANHLFLLSRTEYRSPAVFALLDRDTQRVYPPVRLHQTPPPCASPAHCVAGKVNSAGTLYLVIESVQARH
jgi:hypothetical protein